MVATFLLNNLLPALLAGVIAGIIVLLSIRAFRIRHAVTRLSLLTLPAIKSALVLLGINWVLPWPAELFGGWHARAMPFKVALPFFVLAIGGTVLVDRLIARRETLRTLTDAEEAALRTPRLDASLHRVRAAYAQAPLWRGNAAACVKHEPPRPQLLISRASLSTPIALTVDGTPTIVFPHSLIGWLDDAQLDHALAHELAHFMVEASGWCGAVAHALSVLSPMGPWMRRQLKRETEKACDEMAIRALGWPAAYADTLLTCYRYARDAARSRTSPLRSAPQLLGTAPAIAERIEHVLAAHDDLPSSPFARYRTLALWGFLLVVLFAEIP